MELPPWTELSIFCNSFFDYCMCFFYFIGKDNNCPILGENNKNINSNFCMLVTFNHSKTSHKELRLETALSIAAFHFQRPLATSTGLPAPVSCVLVHKIFFP
jgi:hypothetical protein